MKKFISFRNVCVWISILFFVSCEDEKKSEEQAMTITHGALVVNSGVWGDNKASITYFDYLSKTPMQKIYNTQNNKGLGDTANDLLVYGSKIYMTVTESNVLVIADLEMKEIARIIPADENGATQNWKPRSLTAYEGKVYVTLNNGHQVARVDTTTLKIDKRVAVGRFPEQLIVADNKLYVANSGGSDFPNYNNTVSVIDLFSFTVAKTLQVVTNPCYFEKDKYDNVYLISMGNYGNIAPTLQKINTREDDTVTPIASVPNASFMAYNTPYLYVICSKYNDNGIAEVSYIRYDVQRNSVVATPFITGEKPKTPCSIDVDTETGYVYVGDALNYETNGDMYVYTPEGTFSHKFQVGYNPVSVTFINKNKK